MPAASEALATTLHTNSAMSRPGPRGRAIAPLLSNQWVRSTTYTALFPVQLTVIANTCTGDCPKCGCVIVLMEKPDHGLAKVRVLSPRLG